MRLQFLLIAVLPFAAAASAAQAPASVNPFAPVPGQEPAGTLTGQVVGAIGGEPVGGALVQLQSAGGPGYFFRSVNTDATGHFRDATLPPGPYIVRAQHPRYPGLYGLQPTSLRVQIESGKESTGVVKLLPGGVITGRVLDDDGEPLQGCTVSAASAARQAGRNSFYFGNGAATTDDRGEYRLGPITADRYFVSAHCHQSLPTERLLSPAATSFPNEPRESWQPVYYPNAPTSQGATAVLVGPGAEVRDIDFKMRPTSVTTVLFSVLSAPGTALTNPAGVQMVPDDGSGAMRDAAVGVGFDSRTGLYRATSVASGTYRVFAYSVGEQPDSNTMGEAVIQVGTTPPEPVAIQLQSGLTIHGTVDEPAADPGSPGGAEMGGVVSSMGGEGGEPGRGTAPEPVKGAVRLEPLSQTMIGGGGAGDVRLSGGFELKGVFPGRYRVIYQGYRAQRAIESIEFGDRRAEGNEIEIGAGSAAALHIRLNAHPGRLKIDLGDDGEGEARESLWRIVAIPEAAGVEPPQLRMQSRPRSAMTMDGVASGRYHVVALAANLAGGQDARLYELLKAHSPTTDVGPGAELTVTPKRFTDEDLYQLALDSLTGNR
jgi:hypothetical protein